MLRTALLIVLVTAGTPAGSLACELWCNSPGGDDHHRAVGCHDASQSGHNAREVASCVADCGDAAAMTPFVAEVRQTESRSAAGAPAASFDSGSMGTITTRGRQVGASLTPSHHVRSRLASSSNPITPLGVALRYASRSRFRAGTHSQHSIRSRKGWFVMTTFVPFAGDWHAGAPDVRGQCAVPDGVAHSQHTRSAEACRQR
jgi:hypothetical protein